MSEFMREHRKQMAGFGLEAIKNYANQFLINPDCRDKLPAERLISIALTDLLDHDDRLRSIAADLVEDLNYHDLAQLTRTNPDRARWFIK